MLKVEDWGRVQYGANGEILPRRERRLVGQRGGGRGGSDAGRCQLQRRRRAQLT